MRWLLLPVGGLLVGCAGAGEAVAGACLAVAIQATAEVCCEAAVGMICEDDGDEPGVDEAPAPEVPPPEPERPPDPPPPACRQRLLAGGVWRLDCVDGTRAEALILDPPPGGADVDVIDVVIDGDPVDGAAVVSLTGLADVARLSAVRGLAGTLTIGGPSLLSVSLPSLRTVGGDLEVDRATQLQRLDLPELRLVGGTLRLVHNRLLQQDPCPSLTSATAVDVAFNDRLPPAVVDRLLNLAPPPPPSP